MQIEHYVDDDGEDLFGQSLLALPARAQKGVDRNRQNGGWKFR